MKLKPKGRKIYREHSRSEKLRVLRSNLGSIITTFLLVGALGFVGYSAGGPVIRFLQDRQVIGKPGEYPHLEVIPTEAPEPEPETVAETEPPLTEPEPDALPVPRIYGYRLREASLASFETLDAALSAIPANTTHILLPLKVKGGGLYYATGLAEVNKSTTVKAVLPLGLICEAVKAKGAEPVAVLDLLEDRIYPASYPDAGYLADGEAWKDAAGQLWLSPFSSMTVDYLSHLAQEINDAGFSSIVCEGLVIPDFRTAELTKLDPRCGQPEERCFALTELIRAMEAAAPDAAFYLGVDGADVLSNRNDAISASDQLELDALLVRITPATMAKADMLRRLSTVHPCILHWDETEVPAGEPAYVQTERDETT